MPLKWIGYYRLTDSNVNNYVPQKSGVYKIGIKNEDGFWPIYVGQTKDLNQRMHQYLNLDTENHSLKSKLNNDTCGFKVAEVYSNDRDSAERALYDRYKPECNDPKAIPNVYPADMNCD
jgi:excinuclease UvrABC nuclease subunit